MREWLAMSKVNLRDHFSTKSCRLSCIWSSVRGSALESLTKSLGETSTKKLRRCKNQWIVACLLAASLKAWSLTELPICVGASNFSRNRAQRQSTWRLTILINGKSLINCLRATTIHLLSSCSNRQDKVRISASAQNRWRMSIDLHLRTLQDKTISDSANSDLMTPQCATLMT